jgi:ubiquitin-conjugating enzyme E2 J2
MSNQKLVLLRLNKEEQRLLQEPLEQAWVAREGVLNFHFVIHGLEGAYAGGFYHGLLELSEEYPFAPPRLLFFTPSGRFQTNTPICTSFTNFHKESWTSTWNVRTMVLATISFMTSEEGGTGSLHESHSSRRAHAARSLQLNRLNPLFAQLFKKQLSDPAMLRTPITQPAAQQAVPESYYLYGVYGLLALVVFAWIYLRNLPQSPL